ncbi:MAG TPA: TlpA disulfide reductase family protein [Usitatibacter sp.]|jgi:thiol-disulfide isomerase/thioredoxin|nr:TlpA disulfide reductase family protein [Usitatibacter sp.]
MRRFAAALALLLISQAAGAVEAGAAAPALDMPRLDQPAARLPLASLRGKVVYVDFWASWCVPCRLSMPALETLYREHRDQGFIVVGVNKDVSADDAKRFLGKVGVSFPLVSDLGDAAARGFDVKAMPSGYLVDRKGVVRKVHRGFTGETAAQLRGEIDALMKEPS